MCAALPNPHAALLSQAPVVERFLSRPGLARCVAASWLGTKNPRLHRFLTRRDGKWPLLREVLAGALVLGILVGALYGLTGQPISGGYPVVVVTTGSMMHCENYLQPGWDKGSGCVPTHWGRLGTIDPGDLVFVRHVSNPEDVTVLASEDGSHYGKSGDVIVYRPGGSTAAIPVIHRALFWVDVHKTADGVRFSVPSLALENVPNLDAIPAVAALTNCLAPTLTENFRNALSAMDGNASLASGFVTRGDNNPYADACSTSPGIAHLQWVLGKARGEVPWIGLVNLLWGDITGHTPNYENAGGDSKVMFFVTVAVLIATPWVIEYAMRRRHRKRLERDGDGAE